MLILVAVSVSVALNGGLFNKASDAKDQTKEAVIREQLQDIVLGNLDVNNNTIPEELGSITLDGVTYAITAAEGTPDAETGEKPITITLTASGKEPLNYNLKDKLKIGGVKGVNAKSSGYLKLNVAYGGAYKINKEKITAEELAAKFPGISISEGGKDYEGFIKFGDGEPIPNEEDIWVFTDTKFFASHKGEDDGIAWYEYDYEYDESTHIATCLEEGVIFSFSEDGFNCYMSFVDED